MTNEERNNLDWDDLHLIEELSPHMVPDRYINAFACATSFLIIKSYSFTLFLLTLNGLDENKTKEQAEQLTSMSTIAEYLHESLSEEQLSSLKNMLVASVMYDMMEED